MNESIHRYCETLTTGDRVVVYQKPFTDADREGIATLITRSDGNDDGYERWEIRFPGESEAYYRTVHLRNRLRKRQ